MAESTVVTRTELPDWLRTFQEDILTRAQGLGNQQITMPQYEVAGRTPFQNQASRMAAQGVGSYMPMLQAGATSVGQGVGATQQGIRNLGQAAQMAQGAYAGALPYQQQAYDAMSQSIPTTLAAAQAGQQLSAAGREDLGAAAGQVLAAGQQGLQAATGGAQGILGASQQGQTGILGASAGGAQGQEAARIGSQGLSQLSQQSQLTGQQSASNIQSEAARAEEARQFGLGTARSGIAGLEGASERFDPSQTGAFMNDFEGAAVQQALADIQRASDIKSQGLDAQAVQSGAFGGSRGAIQQAELDRSTLEQQGRTAAGMRQQGYESASQRAQKAYEDALGRQIQSSQTMGQLGQAGAGTSLQATQTGMQGAQQAGAMGLSGLAQAGTTRASRYRASNARCSNGNARRTTSRRNGITGRTDGNARCATSWRNGYARSTTSRIYGNARCTTSRIGSGSSRRTLGPRCTTWYAGRTDGNASGEPSLEHWTRNRATRNTVRATWYAGCWTDGHDCWSIRCNGSRLGWFRNEPSSVGRGTTGSTVKRSKHFNAIWWSGTGAVSSTTRCRSSESVSKCYATISTTWLLLRHLSGYAVIAINDGTKECTRTKHTLSTWWPSFRWVWNVQRNAIRN